MSEGGEKQPEIDLTKSEIINPKDKKSSVGKLRVKAGAFALAAALSQTPSTPNLSNTPLDIPQATSSQEAQEQTILVRNEPILITPIFNTNNQKYELLSVEINEIEEQIEADRILRDSLLEEGYEVYEDSSERAESEYFSKWRELGSKISRDRMTLYDLTNIRTQIDTKKEHDEQESNATSIVVEKNIESLNGEFVLAFELPSGLKFNIYESGQSENNSLKVDPHAVNELIKLLLSHVDNLPEGHYKEALQRVKEEAGKHSLNAIINLVVNTDYGMCVSRNTNGSLEFIKNDEGFYNQLDEEKPGDCIAGALEQGYAQDQEGQILIPIAQLFNPEDNPTHSWGTTDGSKSTLPLTPETSWTYLFAHEITHALYDISPFESRVPRSIEEEHHMLVYPLTDYIDNYEYLSDVHSGKIPAVLTLNS